jgi:hypothetical protein
VVVFFTTSVADLERRFGALKETLAPADGLWIAWPKKTSRIDTDLTFDAVQAIGLAHGLVDNKACAIERCRFESESSRRRLPALATRDVSGELARLLRRELLRGLGRSRERPGRAVGRLAGLAAVVAVALEAVAVRRVAAEPVQPLALAAPAARLALGVGLGRHVTAPLR